MESARRELHQVDAVRQARLEAQQYSFELDQARNELAHKQTQLEELQQHVTALSAQYAARPPAAADEALQEAQLQAADYKYKLQLTELELAKQLDALQELQWQTECVVAQLGLQPQGQGATAVAAAGASAGAGAPATSAPPPSAVPVVDHMLLLSKVEELRMAQLQLDEYKRRLAFSEAELAGTERRCSALQQQLAAAGGSSSLSTAGGAGADPVQQRGQQPAGTGIPAAAEPSSELGSGGKLLVGELLAENEALRQQLAESEERYRSLEWDYEVELLTKAEGVEAAGQMRSSMAQDQQLPPPQLHQPAALELGVGQCREPGRTSRLRQQQHQQQAGQGDAALSPTARRRQAGPVSEAVESIARQRLEFRLQEKDKQLAKMRGVVQELEGKLIDAYKRQADLVMKESSWREQEAQDRRIAQLDDEKARLAFLAQAAQAEAEAARKEAAVQRRLVKRLQQQQQAAAAAGQDGAAGSSSQLVELLQKRVKVLEAQNIKLRLQAKSSKEEEELAAAEAAAARQRQQAADCGSSGCEGNAPCEEDSQGVAAGRTAPENKSPNSSAAAAVALLDNPVLEKWAADKRLQKKVETLQARLRDKTTALVSTQAGLSRAEDRVKQLQEEVATLQGSMQKLKAHLRQAEQRSEPGTLVPVARCQEFLQQLDQLQCRFDALERQHAALQQARPCSSAAPACNADRAQPCAAGDGAATVGHNTVDGAAAASGTMPFNSSASMLRISSSKAYRPSDYSAAAAGCPAPQADLSAQLLQKDVELFDAHLQRDQAVAEAERQRRRLHDLLSSLSPHPHDAQAAAAVDEARRLAGLPAIEAAAGAQAASSSKQKPAGKAGAAGSRAVAVAGAGRRQQPGGREQELLDTIALLESALERTKKGLESGVSSAKYIKAVDKAKQLKAQCGQLEEQLQGAAQVREELSRVQQQLGALHGVNGALKGQLKAAKEQAAEATAAREHMLSVQISELERTLRERDAQMEALNASMHQVDEEVRVLVAEGLRPADLIQELLTLRPRLRELEEQNRQLGAGLAAFDASFFQELEQLKAEHDLLLQQCQRWERFIRDICGRHGEALPLGLALQAASG